MDMVYTDPDWTELGVLDSFTLDLSYGEDENDFRLRIPYGLPIAEESLCYIDDTEWGGLVRGFKEDTTGKTPALYAVGQTWHGLLAETILCPPDGTSHAAYKGDANKAISYAVALAGKQFVFDVETSESGIAIDHQFDRYCTLYEGLRKMLASAGAKLKIAKDPGCKPRLYAALVDDYTSGERALQAGYIAERVRPVNHLVCTGEGENEERIVVHLYADEDGRISRTQTLFGKKERSQRYDYTSADEGTLIADGTKQLEELQEAVSLEISLPNDEPLDIGDRVGVESENADINAVASISKVIVVIGEKGTPAISYETTATGSQLYTRG